MTTVLVVDDEFAIAWSLATQLQDEGYRVVTAANGREALERIAADPPALIITDMMMPVLDGRGLLKALEATPQRDIPVIVMSAVARPTLERQGPIACAGFLRKPFTLRALVDEVRGLIGPAKRPPA